ncbi:probable aminotransferase ACS10 isoform X1 [Olea europaea var. sylvestris]|uniref:probable aminotransferase ACS10 isoform X1 n=1 Tax=Olea europaea var. sylvestris TaxID=158386 RepID=UPI000C1D19A3|nr:probable aminotransferase ACS10 isoform X1 [Olea europaea var. sylvestris]
MKKTRNSTTTTTGGGRATTAMRVIVPLQGIVQGRGGLFLGSVIPCALFYFLQLYLKGRGGSKSDEPPAPTETESSPSETHLPEVSTLQRVHSRLLLSPRGSSGPAQVSSRANAIAKQADGPYFLGLKQAADDPYDEMNNPDGVIQLGLAENRLSLDVVQEWLADNTRESIICQDLSISGIAAYQSFDGLLELKVVSLSTFVSKNVTKPLHLFN